MKRYILIIICLLVSIFSCKVFESGGTVSCGCIELGSTIAFSKVYENYAWGYKNNGWYLNTEGYLCNCTLTVSDSLTDIYNDSIITQAEFNKVLNKASLKRNFAKPSKVDSMIALIRDASGGPFTVTYPGADMGITKYCAYFYDPAKGGFREVILNQTGDAKIVNQSPAATKLLSWLNGIDSLQNKN